MHTVFQKHIRGAQDVLALVRGIGNMVQPALAAAMFLGTGQIVGLVVDGEPAAAETAVIQPDLFGHPRPQTSLHEVAKHGHIRGQQVQMVQPPRTRPLCVKATVHVFQRRHVIAGRVELHRFPIQLEHMAERVLKTECPPMALVTVYPA